MKKSGKIRIDFGAVDSSLTKLSRHFICKCTSHLPEQLREIMNTFTAQYGRLDVFDAARSSDAGGRRRTLSRPSLIFKIQNCRTSQLKTRRCHVLICSSSRTVSRTSADLSRDPISIDRIRWRSSRPDGRFNSFPFNDDFY